MTSCTLEQACVRIIKPACVGKIMCTQDYTCTSPCPENLKMKKIEHKQEKPNSNTLACSKPKQNYILP